MFSSAFLFASFATVMSYPVPSEQGIDIHAAIFRSEDKVSSGGYLTNKFTSLLFTPTIHHINQQIQNILDSIEAGAAQNYLQNILFSTASCVIFLIIIFLAKVIRSFRKKIKVTTSG